MFCTWGLWWALNTCLDHQRGRPEALCWYKAGLRWIRYGEPFLKAFVTPLGPIVELYLDHPEGWL